MELSIIIIVLCGTIVFGQWHYCRQIQTLTEKLMAGNYTNYTQAQVMVQESKKPFIEQRIELPGEDENDEQLRRLNSMIKPPF